MSIFEFDDRTRRARELFGERLSESVLERILQLEPTQFIYLAPRRETCPVCAAPLGETGICFNSQWAYPSSIQWI